jgi:hypothetical protein
MSQTDQLIDNAKSYAQSFDKGTCRCLPASGSRCSPAWTRASIPTACSG